MFWFGRIITVPFPKAWSCTTSIATSSTIASRICKWSPDLSTNEFIVVVFYAMASGGSLAMTAECFKPVDDYYPKPDESITPFCRPCAIRRAVRIQTTPTAKAPLSDRHFPRRPRHDLSGFALLPRQSCRSPRAIRDGLSCGRRTDPPGKTVFSPIAHSHSICLLGLPLDWAFWERHDLEFLQMCDEVVVLIVDGWQASVGVRAEIVIARKLGKPVSFLSPLAEENPGRNRG